MIIWININKYLKKTCTCTKKNSITEFLIGTTAKEEWCTLSYHSQRVSKALSILGDTPLDKWYAWYSAVTFQHKMPSSISEGPCAASVSTAILTNSDSLSFHSFFPFHLLCSHFTTQPVTGTGYSFSKVCLYISKQYLLAILTSTFKGQEKDILAIEWELGFAFDD